MKILTVIILLLLVVLIYATTRPNSFRLTRSILINAPAEKIFAYLTDFHTWRNWSPWENIDPTMQRSLTGAASGVGAVYEWQGKKVGAGRMEIVQAAPSSSLQIKLDFSKPMEAHNFTEFTLQPQGTQTLVTWVMYGPSNYVSKLMTVFISMDKMVGGDFERGLANLKNSSEH